MNSDRSISKASAPVAVANDGVILSFWNGVVTDGQAPFEVQAWPWPELPELFQGTTTIGPKGAGGYVVAAEVNGARDDDNAGPATCIVVDYEPPVGTQAQLQAKDWPGAIVAYTTANHNHARGERWRVFLQVAEPVPAEHYTAMRRALQPLIPVGSAIRGRSQPAYLPTHQVDQALPTVIAAGACALDWRSLPAAPSGRARQPVEPSATQCTEHDAAIVDSLASVWQRECQGHVAFGALGGVLHDAGVLDVRAEWIAETLADVVDSVHPDPVGRVLEAYDEKHDMGWPKLIEALCKNGAGIPDIPGYPATTRIKSVIDEVTRLVFKSVAAVPVSEAANAIVVSHGPDEQMATWQIAVRRDNHDAPAKLLCNVVVTLERHPDWCEMFEYDQFRDRVVCSRGFGHSWQAGETFNPDAHTAGLQEWFSRRLGYDVGVDNMIRMVQHEARRRSFHPVRRYLQSLKWDGVDRNLSAYFGAEPTPYHRAVFSKWLRSAVARVMNPGCKADLLLVLEGKQGIRKSSTIRALCPDQSWFYEVSTKKVGEKDFMSAMRGKWIGELAEVDKLISSRDASELKDLLTRQVDTYRPAYAHVDQDFPRQAVFVGTTNQTEYLRDETGNRRYSVVRCESELDTAGVVRDRDQIWAQALHECVADNAIWWLSPEEETWASAEQADRLEVDAWEDHISHWLAGRSDPFTVVEALGALPGAKPAADLEQRDMNRMGKVLRKLGFMKTRPQTDGVRRVLWSRSGQ